MIERLETAYFRLPLEGVGDAGHGAIESEELVTLELHADGLSGHGYAYTIGRGGRAIQALIEHDLAPLLVGRPAEDVEGLWDLMWRQLAQARHQSCWRTTRCRRSAGVLDGDRHRRRATPSGSCRPPSRAPLGCAMPTLPRSG